MMYTYHGNYDPFSGGNVIIVGVVHGEHITAEAPEKPPDGDDSGNSLEDAARDEHEYPRQRLRDELKREPSEEEMNDWLRQHTEGY